MLRKELKHGDIFFFADSAEERHPPKIVDDGGHPLNDCGLLRSDTGMSGRLEDEVILLKPTPSVAPDAALDPEHYKNLNPEPVAVAEGWDLDRNLSSVIWYIARAGRKEPGVAGLIRDLKKARRFLTRAINLAAGQADWTYRE